METRQFFIDTYLDWRNNYLTIEKFAEHREITEDQAKVLIDLARAIFCSKNPNE